MDRFAIGKEMTLQSNHMSQTLSHTARVGLEK